MSKRISKIIVFIDSVSKIQTAAEYLRVIFYLKSTTSSVSERYTDIPGDNYSIYNIISTFIAHVLKYDQEIRFNKFKNSYSKIRIMVVTISLKMGINIFNIERIIN